MWGYPTHKALLLQIPTVHPHACGDTKPSAQPSWTTTGPPPRVWEYRARTVVTCTPNRSTPTRVGIPAGQSWRGQPSQVHPHACGDTGILSWRRIGGYGPPPRVWGYRILKQGCVRGQLVHPHACGDTFWASLYQQRPYGPPPRVWGYRGFRVSQHARTGSTPTRVGIPSGPARTPFPATVHPHACGDTLDDERLAYYGDGPPPRVWGYQTGQLLALSTHRSTPTRVGIPAAAPDRGGNTQVHPHACGDTLARQARASSSVGPPPRVWGYPRCPSTCSVVKGSTPTRVGIPSRRSRRPWRASVHPHACGDTTRRPPRSQPRWVHPHACGDTDWPTRG